MTGVFQKKRNTTSDTSSQFSKTFLRPTYSSPHKFYLQAVGGCKMSRHQKQGKSGQGPDKPRRQRVRTESTGLEPAERLTRGNSPKKEAYLLYRLKAFTCTSKGLYFSKQRPLHGEHTSPAKKSKSLRPAIAWRRLLYMTGLSQKLVQTCMHACAHLLEAFHLIAVGPATHALEHVYGRNGIEPAEDYKQGE